MGPPHEGSIRRPIAPWANALTTELHLTSFEWWVTMIIILSGLYKYCFWFFCIRHYRILLAYALVTIHVPNSPSLKTTGLGRCGFELFHCLLSVCGCDGVYRGWWGGWSVHFILLDVLFRCFYCVAGARCSSVVRAFAHGEMGRVILSVWWSI